MWLQFSCSLKTLLVKRLRVQGEERKKGRQKGKKGRKEARKEGENSNKCEVTWRRKASKYCGMAKEVL